MPSQVLFVTVAITTLALLFGILRSGRMREKYAALWILIGVTPIVLALWPGLLVSTAQLLGVQVPSNLLFFLSLLLLLAVALHLSLEVSMLEDESRVLAEEVAILRLDLHEVRRRLGPEESPTRPEEDAP